MSYRCVNAFAFDDKVYPGGCEVADDDPIVQTHAENFARVNEPAAATETASAAPGETRTVAPQKAAKPGPQKASRTGAHTGGKQ